MMVWDDAPEDGDIGRGILIGGIIGGLMWVGIIALIRRFLR